MLSPSPHGSVRTPSTTGQSAPTRVVLHSATTLVQAGLRALLEPHRDQVVLTDGGQRPGDVGVIDVNRPDQAAPEPPPVSCPLLALVWDDSPRSTYRAQKVGASVVLPISATAGELVSKIRLVHLDPKVSARRIGSEAVSASRYGDLSSREADILSRICDGGSNADIADDLYLSVNTVKTYIRSAYRKMGVTSRSQAVLWGLDHGF